MILSRKQHAINGHHLIEALGLEFMMLAYTPDGVSLLVRATDAVNTDRDALKEALTVEARGRLMPAYDFYVAPSITDNTLTIDINPAPERELT